MSGNTTAVDRIAHALADKTRGYRGLKGQRQMVELVCEDIVLACDAVKEPDQVITDLRAGSSCQRNRERLVVILADDAFHLVEKARG